MRREGRDVTWLESSSRGNAGIARSQGLLCHSLGAQSGAEDRMGSGNRDASWQSSKQNCELKALDLLGLVNLFSGILTELG